MPRKIQWRCGFPVTRAGLLFVSLAPAGGGSMPGRNDMEDLRLKASPGCYISSGMTKRALNPNARRPHFPTRPRAVASTASHKLREPRDHPATTNAYLGENRQQSTDDDGRGLMYPLILHQWTLATRNLPPAEPNRRKPRLCLQTNRRVGALLIL